jgi:type 1 glutamine amidotransferase
MKTWSKRILLTVSGLVLLAGISSYFVLKSVGLISRDDYDMSPPSLPLFSKPAVLIFSKANGFIHKEAIPAGKKAFAELVEKQGWEAFITDNAAVHSPELLKKFDVVIWNNVSGDVLTEAQREALQQWIEGGGGWLGIHGSGGDFTYDWRWYVDTLIGAQFVGHTLAPQFQDAHVLVPDSGTEITEHLPRPWVVKAEEWYAFDSNPREKGYEILLAVDESSYHTSGRRFGLLQDHMEGEHPVAWRHMIGKGRAVYTSIGHQAATYQVSEYQEFLEQALKWLRGH